MDDDVVLKAVELGKSFFDQKHTVKVFDDVNLVLKKGEKVAIIGASGSGKSTLMHILSGLDLPTTGEVFLKGYHFNQASEAKRGILRNEYLGFIYQFHHLLPDFTAVDNVALPLIIGGKSVHNARREAHIILERVGLIHRLEHKPSALSGGERQRVAIARALVTRPAAVLADEPTGNLDEENARGVFQLLCELNDEIGTALLVVTHDRRIAEQMDKCWQMKNYSLELTS